jgi:hypothetical protein
MISFEEIAAKYPLPREATRYTNFFLDCLTQIESRLPSDAKKALGVARDFWLNGTVTSSVLESERLKIASKYGVGGEDVQIDIEESPFRLVSFVLSRPSGSVADNLDWFDTYLDRFEAPHDMFLEALQQHFPVQTNQ